MEDNLSLEAESGPAARIVIVTHKHRRPRDTEIIISQFFIEYLVDEPGKLSSNDE